LELNGLKRRLADYSPTEVEKIMCELLGQHYRCEVHHVGRSGDGGIDLLLLEGDKIGAVQIKHHPHTNKRESVVPVREFIGAMVLNQVARGVFVTTADGFTGPAKSAAATASRVLAPLNLMSVEDIRAIIKNVAANEWQEYEQRWGDEWRHQM